MIAAGEQAPAFTLRDQDGEDVSLSDFKGRKVLLVFYPMDFSPVCSDQLSIYQELMDDFESKGVKLYGVSVDSAFCHKAFQDKLNLTMPLLADFEPKGAAAKAFGIYNDEHGISNRALFLIDQEGTVTWSYVSPSVLEIPGANLIFDALESAPA
jgi:peroxiredoxin